MNIDDLLHVVSSQKELSNDEELKKGQRNLSLIRIVRMSRRKPRR